MISKSHQFCLLINIATFIRYEGVPCCFLFYIHFRFQRGLLPLKWYMDMRSLPQITQINYTEENKNVSINISFAIKLSQKNVIVLRKNEPSLLRRRKLKRCGFQVTQIIFLSVFFFFWIRNVKITVT